ncbi:MAG: DegV family EDD domain-containing protein [Lachnospiraceae bacterium]|nr:DegV family EDD domain-containing protein [Lachnospiraceae bacterium]
MKSLKELHSRFSGYLYDSDVPMKDRTFVLFTVCELGAIVVYSMIGVLLGDSLKVLLINLIGVVTGVCVLRLCEKKNRLNTARIVLSVILVFIMRPASFFAKGGINNGALLMFLLGAYYLVMVLDGAFRIAMCCIDLFILFICGFVTYFHPELLPEYSIKNDYIFSFVQYIVAFGVLTVLMTFWAKILRKETKKAEEKSEQLEELNRSQNRFFSSMSHEIRTPINTVLGMNELILRNADAPEEIIKDAENIRGAGNLLLTLINDILDISKIEAGRMDIVPVNYNVGTLMSEVVNMIRFRAEEKGLAFNVDIDPEVPEILFGDEVRIRQILINLLNNAVKYTKEGSVSLHVECGFPEEDRVLLSVSVSDTGIGIKPEALPDLFDTFRRVDEEKNRYIEGTGLGLSIVKQLVELMDGQITVNSVYSEGSVFTVTLKQGISSEKRIGDLDIRGTRDEAGTGRFEHSFRAPDARILIVDDNEMNIQVEKKLLDGTGMTVDTALSGAQALALTLKNRYDVIFMDHLMPEMDGIECYEKIRSQTGGMNTAAPVIVLTANAGAENIELYRRAGFDGYLLKPVSGRQLEDMLLLHLPPAKVKESANAKVTGSSIRTAGGYVKKKAVAIAAGSTCDLPKLLCSQLQISIIPGRIATDEGEFLDNVDIDCEELLSYRKRKGGQVVSKGPAKEEYISFFSDALKKAHHVIFITVSAGVSKEYEKVMQAAMTFENVTVVDSGTMSSATGVVAMIAARLAKQNLPVEKIVSELEEAKQLIRLDLMPGSTDLLLQRKRISSPAVRIMNAVLLKPLLKTKNGRLLVGGVLFGNDRKCYEEFVRRILNAKPAPDRSFIFVVYAGLEEDDLLWIEETLAGSLKFDRIIFQKAAAGNAANTGEGTVSFVYMQKGSKNYNIGTIFDNMNAGELSAPEPDAQEAEMPAPEDIPVQKHWYEKLPGIDAAAAIKNSGTQESLRSVMKLFYDTYEARAAELQGYYDNKDWENYTIRVHALKSSARLVGALKLGDAAEALEMAGKSSDTGFIMENHGALMGSFASMIKELGREFGQKGELPPIPEDMLGDACKSLLEFAGAKDPELTAMVLGSVQEYSLAPEDDDRFKRIRNCLSRMDWDGIKDIINERNGGM